MEDKLLLKIIDVVVEEVDYDLHKDMFRYYEDYDYEGSRVKEQRERLIRICKEQIKKDGN